MYKDSRAIRWTHTRHQYAPSCICIMSLRVDNFSRYRLIILKSIYDKIDRRFRSDRGWHLLFCPFPSLWMKYYEILFSIKRERPRGQYIYFWRLGTFRVFSQRIFTFSIQMQFNCRRIYGCENFLVILLCRASRKVYFSNCKFLIMS